MKNNLKLGVDTRINPTYSDHIDRTEGIGPNWSTTETIERNIMNVLNIYSVTNMTTETQDFDTFTCETITIETKDGQKTRIELFRDKPEPVNETELLITSIKGALVRWGLADFPEYERLVNELYHEATKPDRVEPLDFSADCFMGCFSWNTADAPVSFWCAVYDWSVK